jgi:hypothetical protein
MHNSISNRIVQCNKIGHSLFSPTHLHKVSHQLIVWIVIILPTCILDDHVMHDDTSVHDVPKDLLILKFSRCSYKANKRAELSAPIPLSTLQASVRRHRRDMRAPCTWGEGERRAARRQRRRLEIRERRRSNQFGRCGGANSAGWTVVATGERHNLAFPQRQRRSGVSGLSE